jgi:hypothetical protein
MKDLIEALTILMKYLKNKNAHCATHCEHDELFVCDVDVKDVSEEDIATLDKLGFFYDKELGGFKSYRFGSA